MIVDSSPGKKEPYQLETTEHHTGFLDAVAKR